MKNICFDIETISLDTESLRSKMPAFDPELVKVGNLGPEKAAEKIEKFRKEHFERFFRRAALSAITGQVAMIGIRGQDGTAQIIEGPEPEIISAWLKIFESLIEQGGHWIGFNITSFDIPFLVRRAWVHRLRIPYGIVRGRYLTSFFTDLLQLWIGSEYSNQFEVSLDDLARFFGVGLKSGDGADFGELLRYDPKKAREYLTNDLEITWKVAEAMGAFKGPLADQPAGPSGPPDPGPAPQGEPELNQEIPRIQAAIEFY